MSARSALVTGASRGIGRHIAHRLVGEGYALTLSARREPGLHEAARQLRADGAEVHPVVANLAIQPDVEQLVAAHTERFGQLDLLVLNGGVGADARISEMPMKTYDLVLNVNLRAQFLLCQQALPLLRRAAAADPVRGAKVIALASITGLASEPGLGAYGAAKAGLISLCQTLTVEESGNGVTATALAPGYVDTDMAASKHDSLGGHAMLTTNDVAELILAVTRLSAHAVVPTMVLTRAGDELWRA
ncbi:SDR family NAD(P)-dependent oxidoreductase [Mycobacterium intracellulare]|uniref:SDR family NAD(P)-dependent oxidoreductase n=1 Tax=Mycobacterium intracellulare TaxID=1767 RepID=UPI0003D1EA43|nr:SDR family oxidoreductase [Mycobacterium intracellulare]ETB18002.1 short-chain dehydrogenase [Mycobacterium avium 09-5983]ETB33404.1 short-chain dehydrogenase [Mycobacterium avium subsp. hominissuis 10-5606]OCB17791.1 short-chain dehydrogenase [Mycobacterium intracellulare subsp. yongonense]